MKQLYRQVGNPHSGRMVGDSDIVPKRPSGKDELLFDSSTKGRHAFGQHSLREFAGTADHE